jgi:hypothetical protein
MKKVKYEDGKINIGELMQGVPWIHNPAAGSHSRTTAVLLDEADAFVEEGKLIWGEVHLWQVSYPTCEYHGLCGLENRSTTKEFNPGKPRMWKKIKG